MKTELNRLHFDLKCYNYETKGKNEFKIKCENMRENNDKKVVNLR